MKKYFSLTTDDNVSIIMADNVHAALSQAEIRDPYEEESWIFESHDDTYILIADGEGEERNRLASHLHTLSTDPMNAVYGNVLIAGKDGEGLSDDDIEEICLRRLFLQSTP